MADHMKIASVATPEVLFLAYILLNSIRHNKKEQTEVDYWLFVPFYEGHDKQYYQRYFQELIADDFRVHIEDVNWFRPHVQTPQRNYIYYARCLFPVFFKDLDKLLYLDSDTVCLHAGIENLWNTDVSDYYVAAAIDPTWSRCKIYNRDAANTGNRNYFNNGVMLMNLDRIRRERKDQEFSMWCRNWDTEKLQCLCADQTLCNYILKDKLLLVSLLYNNTLLMSTVFGVPCYKECFAVEGIEDPLDSLDRTVIMHFPGDNKPWRERTGDRFKYEYPYKNKADTLWDSIMELYGKKQE